MQVNNLIESTKRKQFSHLHAPRTLDLKGSAWRISAHFCIACVRSISAKVDQRGSKKRTLKSTWRAQESYPRGTAPLETSARSYQYSFEQSILFGW